MTLPLRKPLSPVDPMPTQEPVTLEPANEATPAATVPPPAPVPEPKRDRSGWIVGGSILALTVLGVGAYIAYKALSPEPPKQAPEVPRVSVLVPGSTSMSRAVTITGTIQARYDMPVGPEGEGGRITAVLVEAGDRVQRGQVLARLSTDLLTPQLAQIQAGVEEARADARLKRADYERAVAVPGVLSQAEVDRRRAAADAAAARVQVVQGQLREMQVRLARTQIRAPEGGVVLSRQAEVGQMAMSGSPLFRVAAGAEVELRGQVAEQDLPQLAEGQTARVTLTGLDRVFEGRIRLLDPIIDPASRLGGIRIALPSDPALRPGAFGRATVNAGSQTTPLVPQSAVLADAQGPYVLLVGADNKVIKQRVRVGTVSERGTAITQGLTGTEAVVTTAAAFLRPGETVQPVRGNAAPASR
jgi:RND family efflux transporter MFP subunit